MIVNPDSGPGGANTQPDTNYQGCLAQLKGNSNINFVGYVPTGNGSRSQSDVDADIATYAGWDSSYRPGGIFFDEVGTTSGLLSTYTAYAQTAKRSFGGNGYVSDGRGIRVQRF